MTQPVFTASALSKTYLSGEVEVRALNNVDLEIAEKEVVVLLGPSGSGKSTLLNIMGGLDHPTSGKLFFRDLELTRLSDRDLTNYRRRHVGFVFQFYNLVTSLTAYEYVDDLVESLFGHIGTICRQHAIGAILVEHRVASSMKIADHVLIRNDGEVVFDGAPAQARQSNFWEYF